MVALSDRRSDTNPSDLALIGDLAIELGVVFKPDAKPEAPPAVAMWLFDGTVTSLPGGYSNGELDPDSPVKELVSFPQDLVLVGRSTILIKGLSDRLGIPWSLAEEWAPLARRVLELPCGEAEECLMNGGVGGRVRFREVVKVVKGYGRGRVERVLVGLSPRVRSRVASVLLRLQERREKRQRGGKV